MDLRKFTSQKRSTNLDNSNNVINDKEQSTSSDLRGILAQTGKGTVLPVYEKVNDDDMMVMKSK